LIPIGTIITQREALATHGRSGPIRNVRGPADFSPMDRFYLLMICAGVGTLIGYCVFVLLRAF
jgi:hypothetical protein